MAWAVRVVFVAMLCAASAPGSGWVRGSVAAQVLPRDGELASIVEFTGPTYGVTVPYPGDWQVVGSGAGNEVDYLHLTNGTSRVSVVVGPGPKDVLDCVDGTALRFRDAVAGFEDLRYTGTFFDDSLVYGARFDAPRGEMVLIVVCKEFGHPVADIGYAWSVGIADFEAELMEASSIVDQLTW